MFCGVVALLALGMPAAGSGCGRGDVRHAPPTPVGQGSATPAASAPPPGAQVDAALLDSLALLAMGKPADAALGAEARQQWLRKILSGQSTIEGYIDTALASPGFLADVAPEAILGEDIVRRGKVFLVRAMLRSSGEGAQKVYFLRKPCPPGKAVKVKPWWDLGSEVLVCRDSYRPRVYRHRDRDTWVYCGAMLEKPGCGCGPNLIRCTSSGAQRSTRFSAMTREIAMTAAYVAEHDLPLASLFTMNETVRDWSGELVYRLIEAAPDGATDVTARLTPEWSAPELRARRELWPGQHAGILTAPKVIRGQADARQVMREIYKMMWCSTVESKGATAQAVLSLGKSNLQGLHEGWEELARRPVCTSCHARLDYGMQFFRGYADPRSPGAYAMPELVRPGKSELYGRDISDPRGKEIATPAGFARLATTQPEFAACMSQRVVAHVFGHDASAADHASVRAAYDRAPTARNLMKTALLRYAQRWIDSRAAAASTAGAGGTGEPVADSKRLRALLEEHCFACHDDAQKPDLSPAGLPVDVLFDVVAQVAYGGMPKGDNDMTPEERTQLVRSALRTVLPKPAWASAESYFIDRGLAFTVHDIDSVFAAIEWLARPEAAPLPAVEWSIYEREQDFGAEARQWSPSFSATIGFKALQACHAAGFVGRELDACLERATDPAALSKTARPIAP